MCWVLRFPNLVVGVLTRDSIRQALRGGITAEQIIGYLTQHAHPQMLQNERKHPLPPTVVDQIKLWELERNRLTYSDGVLYSQFLSQVTLIELTDCTGLPIKQCPIASNWQPWINKCHKMFVLYVSCFNWCDFF